MEFRTERRVPELLGRIEMWWSGFSDVLQLYFTGAFLALIWFVLVSADQRGLSSQVAGGIAVVMLGLGVVLEAYRWVVAKLELPIVKWLMALVGVMAAAGASGAGAAAVNAATGQDPAYFKFSIAFLAPISFLPVAAILVMVVAFASILWIMLFSITRHLICQEPMRNETLILLLSRVVGMVVIITLASVLPKSMGEGVKSLAGYAALLLDMHRDTACAPARGDYVVRINDGFVVVGRITSDGPKFIRKACVLAAE